MKTQSIRAISRALEEMDQSLESGKIVYRPSKYWEMLNAKNLEQLKKYGTANFKQHQALNYFTFLKTLTREDSDQLKFLLQNNSLFSLIKCIISPGNLSPEFSPDLSAKTKWLYQVFTRLLWEYALGQDRDKILLKIEEPLLGNPFPIVWRRRLISQDLANSVLEYYSITEASGQGKNDYFTCAELGSGYGRNAYIFLNQHPNVRYLLVDIPPALLIAQEYLGQIFKRKKIFKFRNFTQFRKVRAEFESSQIIFLTPPQLELLSKKSINIFLTISSLHEMRPDQIRNYLQKIDDLTVGIFYMKQWKMGYVVGENVYIKEEDYPIPKNWNLVYSREARVQTKFFEKAYQIDQ